MNVCLNAYYGIAMRQSPNYPAAQIQIVPFPILLPLKEHLKSPSPPGHCEIIHLEIRHICGGTWGTISGTVRTGFSQGPVQNTTSGCVPEI